MSREQIKQEINDNIKYNRLKNVDSFTLNPILNDIVDEMALGGGIIEEGNTQAVSGGEVYDKTLTNEVVIKTKDNCQLGYYDLTGTQPSEFFTGTTNLGGVFELNGVDEVFLEYARGGNASRTWAFVDINNNIISRATQSLIINEITKIDIPQGAVKLYINSSFASSVIYRDQFKLTLKSIVKDKFNKLIKDNSQTISTLNYMTKQTTTYTSFKSGYYDLVGVKPSEIIITANSISNVFNVEKVSKVDLTRIYGGANGRAYAFTDASDNIILVSETNARFALRTLDVPENAVHLYVNSFNSDSTNYPFSLVKADLYFTEYPVVQEIETLKNKSVDRVSFFEIGSSAYNNDILTQAIEELEWYDNNYKGSNVSFYALGNNFTSGSERRTYLSFRDYRNIAIFPVGWTDVYTIDSANRTGIEKFFLKKSRNNDNDIIGYIVINWDKIPSGYRAIETTSYVNNSKLKNFNDNLLYLRPNLKKPYIDGDYDSWVDFNKVTGSKYSDGSSVPLIVKTLDNLYSEWDSLLSYPFVTKELVTDLVPSDNGNVSIFKFTFSMPINRDTGPQYPIYRPKIILNLSIHSYEKMPSICTLEFMREVCANYKENSFYLNLLTNFDIIIIPCANPSTWNSNGFNGLRTNFNGVDLNRNFPFLWQMNGSHGSDTWSGNNALSEIETQKISELLNSINYDERFLFIDFHNFFGTELNPMDRQILSFLTPQDECGYYVGRNLINTFTKKVQKENPEVPQNWDFQAGYSAWNYQRSVGGFCDVFGYSLGFKSTTLEVARNYRYDNSAPYSDKAVNYGVQTIANYIRLAVKAQSSQL